MISANTHWHYIEHAESIEKWLDKQSSGQSLRFDTYEGALDISFVSGDEVTEQTEEILKDLKLTATTAEEQRTLRRLTSLDARFDIFHFNMLLVGPGRQKSSFVDQVLQVST